MVTALIEKNFYKLKVLDKPVERKEKGGDKEFELKVERDYSSKDMKVEFRGPLITLDEPRSIAAEQYRILCARFQQISARKSYKIFAVTSALKGEGKTTTSLNLAYLMAHEFKKKVLLIDGDMRNPSMPVYLETEVGRGLVDILRDGVDPASSLLSLNGGNFTFLPHARESLHVSNPSEFFSSPKMGKLLDYFKNIFDYVIIDAPPILPVADMNILSEVVDGMLLVVKADKTPRDLVLKAMNSLNAGEVVGLVLNSTNISSKRYSYYKY